MRIIKDPIFSFNCFSFKGKHNTSFKKSTKLYQGRYAIFKILQTLELKKDDVVLIPSFHCLAMIEPILKYGCKFDFYKIRKDLITSLKDIETKITIRTKVVFIVHYFGIFQKNTKAIKAFLSEKGIICIEDCAHIIPCGNNEAGSIGDISIFSPRKFLPVIDGAMLCTNNSSIPKVKKTKRLPLLRELKNIKNAFERQLSDSKFDSIKNKYYFIDKTLKKIVPRTSSHAKDPFNIKEKIRTNIEFDINLIDIKFSGFASIFIKYSDFDMIYQKRLQAFKFLYSEIYDSIGLKPPEFISSEESTCILGFPILTNNKKAFITELKRKKISHFTFGEILYQHLNKKKYIMPDNQLYEQLVFVPCHQDLDKKKLKFMAESIKQILLH